MKRILFVLFASLLFISCEKVEDVPETMTFKINGVSKSFSKTIEIYESTSSNLVTILGTVPSSYESIEISLPRKGTGIYTEETYNSMGSVAAKPNIRYTDANGNIWKYYGSYYGDASIKFTIDVKKYSSTGEISGTFNGKLWASSGNGSNSSLTIEIEDGVFSHDMYVSDYK